MSRKVAPPSDYSARQLSRHLKRLEEGSYLPEDVDFSPSFLDLRGKSEREAATSIDAVTRRLKREEIAQSLQATLKNVARTVKNKQGDGIFFDQEEIFDPLDWLSWRDGLQIILNSEFEGAVRLARCVGEESVNPATRVEAVVRQLHLYDVVLWEREVWDLSRQRAEAWTNTPLAYEDLTVGPQFWVYQKPMRLDDYACRTLRLTGEVALSCIGCMPVVKAGKEGQRIYKSEYDPSMGPLGVLFWLCFNPRLPAPPGENDLDFAWNTVFPRLRFLPPVYHGDLIPPAIAELIAAMFWLTLPIVEKGPPRHGTRQQDRAWERKREDYRKKNPKHSSAIQIITLRKKEYLRKDGEEKEKREVDWKWRWDVKGHWRRRRKDEEPGPPRWIEDYEKGPKNMPKKEKSKSMFHAKR